MDTRALSITTAHAAPRPADWRTRPGLYVMLTKARLSAMVVFTAFVGYVLGARGEIRLTSLLGTLLGTAVAAFGAAAFNQWMEVRRDKLMEHTRARPLPAKRMSPTEALIAAVAMLIAGPVILVLAANLLTALLALASALVYLVIYTPLKTRTSLCTLVGAVTGALPPMLGWTAATGRLDAGAWVLGGILFIWQIPHFLALAWRYRESYRRAGFRVISVSDPTGRATAMMTVVYSLVLLPVSLMGVAVGLAGWGYAFFAAALDSLMLWLSLRFLRQRTDARARNLFAASIIYLGVLMVVLLIDRGPAPHSVPAVGVAEAAPDIVLVAAGGHG